MTCKMLTGLLVLAWLAGVAMFFGYAATENDTLDLLAGLVLTPLGLPWNLIPIFSGGSGSVRMGVALAAPVINIVIFWWLCRMLARRLCPQGC